MKPNEQEVLVIQLDERDQLMVVGMTFLSCLIASLLALYIAKRW